MQIGIISLISLIIPQIDSYQKKTNYLNYSKQSIQQSEVLAQLPYQQQILHSQRIKIAVLANGYFNLGFYQYHCFERTYIDRRDRQSTIEMGQCQPRPNKLNQAAPYNQESKVSAQSATHQPYDSNPYNGFLTALEVCHLDQHKRVGRLQTVDTSHIGSENVYSLQLSEDNAESELCLVNEVPHNKLVELYLNVSTQLNGTLFVPTRTLCTHSRSELTVATSQTVYVNWMTSSFKEDCDTNINNYNISLNNSSSFNSNSNEEQPSRSLCCQLFPSNSQHMVHHMAYPLPLCHVSQLPPNMPHSDYLYIYHQIFNAFVELNKFTELKGFTAQYGIHLNEQQWVVDRLGKVKVNPINSRYAMNLLSNKKRDKMDEQPIKLSVSSQNSRQNGNDSAQSQLNQVQHNMKEAYCIQNVIKVVERYNGTLNSHLTNSAVTNSQNGHMRDSDNIKILSPIAQQILKRSPFKFIDALAIIHNYKQTYQTKMPQQLQCPTINQMAAQYAEQLQTLSHKNQKNKIIQVQNATLQKIKAKQQSRKYQRALSSKYPLHLLAKVLPNSIDQFSSAATTLKMHQRHQSTLVVNNANKQMPLQMSQQQHQKSSAIPINRQTLSNQSKRISMTATTNAASLQPNLLYSEMKELSGKTQNNTEPKPIAVNAFDQNLNQKTKANHSEKPQMFIPQSIILKTQSTTNDYFPSYKNSQLLKNLTNSQQQKWRANQPSAQHLKKAPIAVRNNRSNAFTSTNQTSQLEYYPMQARQEASIGNIKAPASELKSNHSFSVIDQNERNSRAANRDNINRDKNFISYTKFHSQSSQPALISNATQSRNNSVFSQNIAHGNDLSKHAYQPTKPSQKDHSMPEENRGFTNVFQQGHQTTKSINKNPVNSIIMTLNMVCNINQQTDRRPPTDQAITQRNQQSFGAGERDRRPVSEASVFKWKAQTKDKITSLLTNSEFERDQRPRKPTISEEPSSNQMSSAQQGTLSQKIQNRLQPSFSTLNISYVLPPPPPRPTPEMLNDDSSLLRSATKNFFCQYLSDSNTFSSRIWNNPTENGLVKDSSLSRFKSPLMRPYQLDHPKQNFQNHFNQGQSSFTTNMPPFAPNDQSSIARVTKSRSHTPLIDPRSVQNLSGDSMMVQFLELGGQYGGNRQNEFRR